MRIRELFYFALFIIATVISAGMTYAVRNLAIRHGLVRGPESRRHVHKRPMPRVGGIALYFTVTGLLLFVLFADVWLRRGLSAQVLNVTMHIFAPATMLFLVGLYDDLKGVGAKTKMFFQIIAGVWLHLGGHAAIPADVMHYVNPTIAPVLSLGATVLWVLWISNAFNLIDGLDGLAAGTALFSLITLMATALIYGNNEVVLVSVILGGAILGFLRYNFNPATVFLGDGGSLFLGFTLSALALWGHQAKAPTLVAIAIPLVSFGLPIVETVVSVIRRFLSGKPIFTADRNHIHHRLMEMGMSHRQVVTLLYGVSGLLAFLSIFLMYPNLAAFGLVFALIGLMLFMGIQKLGYPEFNELGRLAMRTMQQKDVIANNVQIRRASTMLREAASFDDIKLALDTALAESDFDAYEMKTFVRESGMPGPVRRTGTERLVLEQLSWSRAGFEASTPRWTMHMDLVTSSYSGSLNIHRHYDSRSLLLDINVLVDELQPALADAIQRLATDGQRKAPRVATARTEAKAAVGSAIAII